MKIALGAVLVGLWAVSFVEGANMVMPWRVRRAMHALLHLTVKANTGESK